VKLVANEERCTGCRACEMVCAFSRYEEQNPKMAALRVGGEFPDPGRYHLTLCTQCGICADECPEGAIALNDAGGYVIDPETCTNCGVCVDVCPEAVIYTHAAAVTPIKCDLCGECVELCPRDVLAVVV